jgi:hypothetical protein
VDLKNIQMMYCIHCYQTFVCGINPITQMRKGLIFCYKTYGITFFLKHVDANHMLIAKKFKEEVNNLLKEKEKRQPSKKITNLSSGSISNFFHVKDFFKKQDVPQNTRKKLCIFD